MSSQSYNALEFLLLHHLILLHHHYLLNHLFLDPTSSDVVLIT